MTNSAAPPSAEFACRLAGRLVSADAGSVLRLLIASTDGTAAKCGVEASALARALACGADDLPGRIETLQADARRVLGFAFFQEPGGRPTSGFVLATAKLDAFLRTGLYKVESGGAAVPDAKTAAWVRTVAAAPAGHCFAARVVEGGLTMADLAAVLEGERPGEVHHFGDGDSTVAAALIRCELHAASARTVIVVGPSLLVYAAVAPSMDDGLDGWEPGASACTVCEPSQPALQALSAAGPLRCTYVWSIPEGRFPSVFLGVVVGIVGPMLFDEGWALDLVGSALPKGGDHAAGVLLALVGDPRRVGDAATAVASSHDVDLARSSGRERIDQSLAMADKDIPAMIRQAGDLAANGARVLFWGPPAGGKTALALALCKGMLAAQSDAGVSRRSVVMVDAASVLSGRWGRTERLVAARFKAASAMRVPLFADEFDAFCGVRSQGGEDTNNGSLVRSLTDAWLRGLDRHPEVPVVAACNDLMSIDPAARRRFHFVVRVDAVLSPDRERRAWAVMLACDPPRGWQAVGAALGDIALVRARCRMLGRADAKSLADASEVARRNRLGISASCVRRALH